MRQETGKDYRLPTEAEWEYVARASTSSKYWWGNKASHNYANYGKDKGGDGLTRGADKWFYTSPVGSFPMNNFQVHDMHGNVWKRVEDCWHGSYKNAPSDGSAWLQANGGDCANRVMRGGAWFNYPGYIRSAIRLPVSTGVRDIGYGFRVSRTLN